MTDDSHTLEPGSTFGQHRIVRLLGRGGMGEVYEVLDESGAHHALKLLNIDVMEVSGVLERFPNLKIICAENGTEWVPSFVKRIDPALRRKSIYPTQLTLKPSEYIRRQIYFTYIHEAQAVLDRYEIGVNNLMWSSDYPHNASSWPNSQEVVQKSTFDAVKDETEQYKLVRENGMKLYGLDPVSV